MGGDITYVAFGKCPGCGRLTLLLMCYACGVEQGAPSGKMHCADCRSGSSMCHVNRLR